MPDLSLSSALCHPRRQMQHFAAQPPTLATLPLATWAGLVGIAVGGSVIYGASLSLRFPGWRPDSGALWLALSAGLGWCVFGPALVLVTQRNPLACAHACLVTMAYGEAVLLSGAVANLLHPLLNWLYPLDPLHLNLATVSLSNVVMAAALALQLRELGVPATTTLLLWMGALNGSGALFFWLFHRLLHQEVHL
ncbi:MAG: hypothetical protein HC914_14690 [Chloroflexaceae bacterium]|nr:hypothetical protein [Chloroflexaceae bacterium]